MSQPGRQSPSVEPVKDSPGPILTSGLSRCSLIFVFISYKFLHLLIFLKEGEVGERERESESAK